MSIIIDNLILSSRAEIINDKFQNDTSSNIIDNTKLHINAAKEVEQLFKNDGCIQINLNWNDYPHQNINQNGILFNLVKMIDSFIINDKQVLINCFAGVSRSATIVIAYLIYKNKWDITTVISYVKSKRFINPNYGFICQLYNLQDKLHNLDENFIEYSSKHENKTVFELADEIMETCKLPLIERLCNDSDLVIIL
jgi:protein-tyrosine phosphatase